MIKRPYQKKKNTKVLYIGLAIAFVIILVSAFFLVRHFSENSPTDDPQNPEIVTRDTTPIDVDG